MAIEKVPGLKNACCPRGPRNDVRGQDVVEDQILEFTKKKPLAFEEKIYCSIKRNEEKLIVQHSCYAVVQGLYRFDINSVSLLRHQRLSSTCITLQSKTTHVRHRNKCCSSQVPEITSNTCLPPRF